MSTNDEMTMPFMREKGHGGSLTNDNPFPPGGERSGEGV
jgi:hypothetical protein